MSVVIREHLPGTNVADFIEAGHVVYAGDPAWVAPLHFELKERFNPNKNPFFQRADVTLFTAWKDGKLAGRCSATVDREHLRVWADDTGFFGFFDTINDEEVARALLNAAEDWLRRRGMKRMIGPFSLYANEEMGILIEGFEHPPVIMMSHSRPYQMELCDKLGLLKEKDLWAWRYEEGEFPPRVVRAWEEIRKLPEVKLRSIDMKNLDREIQAVMDIYNDAWSGKWSYVPALPEEVKKVTADLRLVLDPDVAFMAEIDGKIQGMCILLPNLNEVVRDFDGKLFPFNWTKLLYRLKVKKPVSTRLMMLGIKKEVRANVKRYGGLSAAMYLEVAKRGLPKGYKWGELSWTREDDRPINLGIQSMGAKVYKKYRVYQKAL
jgi:GNAT superfamily N-acetyltransferase